MSVRLVLITVTRMLTVPTPLVASPVPVTRDTVGKDSLVRYALHHCGTHGLMWEAGRVLSNGTSQRVGIIYSHRILT